MAKKEPNIIITGTPGVGKTSHCEVLCQHTGLKHLSINQIVKERGCQEEWDEELQSWIVDEDKVREPRVHEVPSRWLIIVVLAPWFHWKRSKARWLYHWLACLRLVPAQLDRSGHSFEDKFNKTLWQAYFKTIPGAQVTGESWLGNHAGSAWGS